MVALISFSACSHSTTISGSQSVNLQDVRDQTGGFREAVCGFQGIPLTQIAYICSVSGLPMPIGMLSIYGLPDIGL